MPTTLEAPAPVPPTPVSGEHPHTRRRGVFDRAIVGPAIVDSFRKLDPRVMISHPVMFVVEIGSVYTSVLFVRDFATSSSAENVFAGLVTLFLWATVLFANFAEAMAEGRGKAQAASLRKTRSDTIANVRRPDGSVELVPSSELDVGDECVVSAGEVIPSDGDVIEGIASVDESAITGESAPVIRESGGDRSAVTGGTRVLSDQIVVRITAKPGETFLDRMIALVEGADRQKTPNEIALSILLAGLTIIFFFAVASLQPFAIYAGAGQSVIVLVALLVCLIPTTIGGLLSAIGIAGMDRLVQRNVLAMSGRAVEAAGDVSTLLLDKTGTITVGNRHATELLAVHDVTEEELAEAALLSSLADETPEGRSIVELCVTDYGVAPIQPSDAALVPFSAETRMSGVDLSGSGREIRKGAADAVRRYVAERGGSVPPELTEYLESISREGGTPLVVADGSRILGVIRLKDIVKDGPARPLRRAPPARHPHRDDHGRQPAHGRGHRRGGRSRRVPRRGDARAEAGADQAGATWRQPGRHDRRRHQRRARPRPGGRRRGHEHRHAGSPRGRQHGRPRLRPDEAHRDRRDRQAAAHHPRLAHHLLHRQRRGQVLRHHPGDVLRPAAGPRTA